MRRFAASELVEFLSAVDQVLSRRVEVVVIGGTAASVHYGVSRTTQGIDTWTRVGVDLASALQRARDKTGLAVPFSQSSVADAPYDFESRLERTRPWLVDTRPRWERSSWIRPGYAGIS